MLCCAGQSSSCRSRNITAPVLSTSLLVPAEAARAVFPMTMKIGGSQALLIRDELVHRLTRAGSPSVTHQ